MANRWRARAIDAVYVSGLASVTIGVSCCWSVPIGLIVLGAVLIVTSVVAVTVG